MNDLLIASLARLDLSTQQSTSSRRGRRTPPSFQTLSDSSSSNSPSPTPSTSSFESDSDETISARSDTLSFLSGSSDSFTHTTTTRKLLFYHSLLTLFGVGVRPPSIKKCVAILRGIHVNLKEFLAYIHNGGNISQVTRYPSRRALINALVESGSYVKLKQAKKEMLSPLLVTIYWK